MHTGPQCTDDRQTRPRLQTSQYTHDTDTLKNDNARHNATNRDLTTAHKNRKILSLEVAPQCRAHAPVQNLPTALIEEPTRERLGRGDVVALGRRSASGVGPPRAELLKGDLIIAVLIDLCHLHLDK